MGSTRDAWAQEKMAAGPEILQTAACNECIHVYVCRLINVGMELQG